MFSNFTKKKNIICVVILNQLKAIRFVIQMCYVGDIEYPKVNYKYYKFNPNLQVNFSRQSLLF